MKASAWLGIGAVALLALAGWWRFSVPHPEDRVYRIGWEEDPPNMFTGRDGQPDGFGPDLISTAAERRGIRLRWVHCPESSEMALRGGKVDLWPTMTVLEERKKFIYFSKPYLNNYMKVLARADSGLRRLADLQGKRVALKDLPLNRNRTKLSAPGATLIPVPTTDAALGMLARGEADAVMGDDLTIGAVLMRGGERGTAALSELETDLPPYQLAIGARFEARAAADALRAELEEMALQGELSRFLTRWGRATARDASEMAALLRAYHEVRRLKAAAVLLAAIFLVTLALALAYRRQRRRILTVEEARRQAQQRLDLVTEGLTEMILVYDMQRRLIYHNPAALQITGLGAAELAAAEYGVWAHPRERERLTRHWLRCFEGAEFHLAPYHLAASDGSNRWMAASWGPVRDESGRQIGVRGSERDITDVIEAQSEARRLAEAVQQSSDSVVITDTNGTIEFVNPAFERISGYRREEAIGRNPNILKSGRQPREFYEEMWKTILSGRSWTGKLENRRKNGSIFIEQCSISPIFNEDSEIERFVAVKNDITHEIELGEEVRQAQKMESIGKLAGGVAHDFNNLLTVINGNAHLAQTLLPEHHACRSRVDAVLAAGERAADLTRQLLAFSRRQPLQPELMDVCATLSNMAPVLHSLMDGRCKLRLECPAGVPPVLMDVSQFEQVVLNLCVNARDAMDGGGEAAIRVFSGDHEVLLEVSDTGLGIPEEIMGQIFEPFFTTKPKGQGTGLGLAVVYGIVTQSGGRIEVSSAPGAGTRFLVRLPASDGRLDAARPGLAPAAELPFRKILVVEDQTAVRSFVSEVLKTCGCEVIEAEDAVQALRLAALHPDVEVLLTDVSMPGMDGEDLAEAVSAGHPGIKVLLMSGYSRGTSSLKWPVLQKPFSPGRLVEELKRAAARP